jgi:hypothetical protein
VIRFAFFFTVLVSAALAGGCNKSPTKTLPPDYKDPVDPANMPAMPKSPSPVAPGEPSNG